MQQPSTNHQSSIKTWLVWFTASFFLLYQFLLQTSSSVMIPDFQVAFGINVAQVGLLSASFFYTYLFMQVPSGILVDKFGARKTLIVSLSICVVAVWVFAHATSIWVAFVCRMLMGFVSAPAFAAGLYITANWFAPQRFAFVAGLTETLGMVGGMLGQALLAQLVQGIGWRFTLSACAVVAVFAVVAVWMIVYDTPPHQPRHTHLQDATFKGVLSHLKKVIGLPQVWLIGLFSGMTFALVTALGGLWGVPYLEIRYNLPPTTTALACSMIFLGVAVGSPFWGWLSDWLGRRKPVMLFCTLACFINMIFVLYIPDVSFVEMVVMLFGLGFTASVYMLPFALVRELTPKEVRGTAMGFTNMFSILIGSPILQPLIGHLLELHWDHQMKNGIQVFQLSDYRFALSLLPLCLALAFLLFCFISETYCRETSA